MNGDPLVIGLAAALLRTITAGDRHPPASLDLEISFTRTFDDLPGFFDDHAINYIRPAPKKPSARRSGRDFKAGGIHRTKVHTLQRR